MRKKKPVTWAAASWHVAIRGGNQCYEREISKRQRDMPDPELERFKTEINLCELASSYGYEVVRKESSRASVVMEHPDGNKMVIRTDPDGHMVFFSVRNEGQSSRGSVIDFVMHREGVSLGGARQILRKCLTPGYMESHSKVHYRPVATDGDHPEIYTKWLRLQPYNAQEHHYLQERGLKEETIAAFSERIRVDGRGNVCFRHDDLKDFAGWELKNKDFTGFVGGGKKALFGCKVGYPEKGDAPFVVVTESGIDSMSYYQANPQPGFYLSIAGHPTHSQIELLTWVLNRYPAARVVAATDADEKGEAYARLISQIRPDAERHKPPIGKDWNDAINGREARPASYAPPLRFQEAEETPRPFDGYTPPRRRGQVTAPVSGRTTPPRS